MKIGELANKAGCPVETIRYYEKKGLLQAPLRNLENNYRYYDNTHLEKLLFLRRCRALDMTHEEIHALLKVINSHGKNCGGIGAIIDDHIAHVQHRIAELLTLEKHLKELKNFCNADRSVDECGIVQKLMSPEQNEELTITLSTEHLGHIH